MKIINDIFELKGDEEESLISLFQKNNFFDSIFHSNEKENLFFYRNENKFYGKLDTHNNAVMLKNSFITDLTNNSNAAVACDVVSQAFSDMILYYEKAKSVIPKDSFYTDLKPVSTFRSVNNLYVNYVEKYFSYFQNYLTIEDFRNLKNPKNFFDMFVRGATFFIKKQSYPLTKTAFITSPYCNLSSNGLVINLTSNTDSIQNVYENYLSDVNFLFFLETARKFNFLVDKEKPWRLIFNIFDEKSLLRDTPVYDCEETLPDGTVYIPPNAVLLRPMGYFKMFNIESTQDFFEKRYDKTMIGTSYDETTEFESLKILFIKMYNSIAVNNVNILYGKENKKQNINLILEKREPLYDNDFNKFISNESWLKFLLYVRALETKQKWNQTDFETSTKKMIVIYKNYGIRNACNFINQITKNIFDVDGTSTRVVNRSELINREFSEPEGFIF